MTCSSCGSKLSRRNYVIFCECSPGRPVTITYGDVQYLEKLVGARIVSRDGAAQRRCGGWFFAGMSHFVFDYVAAKAADIAGGGTAVYTASRVCDSAPLRWSRPWNRYISVRTCHHQPRRVLSSSAAFHRAAPHLPPFPCAPCTATFIPVLEGVLPLLLYVIFNGTTLRLIHAISNYTLLVFRARTVAPSDRGLGGNSGLQCIPVTPK